jgi:hypothetical protein
LDLNVGYHYLCCYLLLEKEIKSKVFENKYLNNIILKMESETKVLNKMRLKF